ncbi:hypothetical protein WUBG_14279 [Wuchereria bancrofti]|uniref:Uncharacterized protein n=1 Tax=Wuchereria bancrofti TaxID=6293 RepID=J9DYJ2_WUCBA|nr:hypothetical protein WUBG_14279 [Wuchereria bancrofti]
MRVSKDKHRESIVSILSLLHLPSIATAKRPILKPGCLFLCWFGWKKRERTFANRHRHHQHKNYLHQHYQLYPHGPVRYKKPGSTKKPIAAMAMMSAINFEKKGADASAE